MGLTLSDLNITAVIPHLAVLILGLLLLFLSPLLSKKGKEVIPHLAWLGLAIALFLVIRNWFGSSTAFGNMLIIDHFSNFFDLIFILSSILVIFSSISYLKREGILKGEYFVLVIFATFGMMLMASALDLIVIFLGLEIMSISLYILAGFNRDDIKSNESSMKYFLMGAFASGFLLYGIAFVYGAIGSTNLGQIALAFQELNLQHNLLFLIGIGLILVGFGFKVALVPFHMWVPDVYQGAPTPITAFISAGPKAAGFAALLRVFLFSLQSAHIDWAIIFWILAAATMTLGNIVAISQSNIKRMLAYSSIAHAGYVMVGLVAGGFEGLTAAMFYLMVYIFMNIGAFAIIIALGIKGEDKAELSDYTGLADYHPWLAIFMAIFMFSLAGFPPTAGFMAKFYIFSSAVKQGYIWLVIIGVLNSLVSVYFYLRVVVVMFMHKPSTQTQTGVLPFGLILTILFTIAAVLYLGLFPQNLLTLANLGLF